MRGRGICTLISIIAIASAGAASDTAETCGILTEIWETKTALEECAGVSFADTNLRMGTSDPVLAELALAAEQRFELPSEPALDLVISLALFEGSRIDEYGCKPETFDTAAKQLLVAYGGAPESEVLADVVAQLLVADEDREISSKLNAVLVSLRNPCEPVVMLHDRIRGSSTMPLMESVFSNCSEAPAFLTALGQSLRSELLRASVAEEAWRACRGSCDSEFVRMIQLLAKVGLPGRVVDLISENPGLGGPAVTKQLVASLVLTHDLAKATDAWARRNRGADSPESAGGVDTVIAEILRDGAVSSLTAAEAYLSDPTDLVLLQLLERFSPSELRGTRAGAARALVDSLTDGIDQASTEVSSHPFLQRFSGAAELVEIERREAEARYADSVLDVPGALHLASVPYETAPGRSDRCQGVAPVEVNSLCLRHGLEMSQPGACVFAVSDGPLGPGAEGIWAVCRNQMGLVAGVMGVVGRRPFEQSGSGFGDLSAACIERDDPAVRLILPDRTIAFDADDLIGDPDGDHLSNSFEALLGTDPQAADSDGDGMPDSDDPVPSFSADSTLRGGWRSAAETFWNDLVTPVFNARSEAQPCEAFGGTLFIVAADRELGITAACTGARVVPLLPHEVSDLIPPNAVLTVRVHGIDDEKGVAFFDWSWGSAGGMTLLERSDNEWKISFEEQALASSS